MEGKTIFPVKREDYNTTTTTDPKDTQRLEIAWGDKHRKKDDFMYARNGDHLIIPYECPLCVF